MSAIQYKIMPEGLDVDLGTLKTKVEAKITELGGMPSSVEEQPIAFGLKALIVTIALSEDEESDAVEKTFSEIEGISSVELIDYRRVIG